MTDLPKHLYVVQKPDGTFICPGQYVTRESKQAIIYNDQTGSHTYYAGKKGYTVYEVVDLVLKKAEL